MSRKYMGEVNVNQEDKIFFRNRFDSFEMELVKLVMQNHVATNDSSSAYFITFFRRVNIYNEVKLSSPLEEKDIDPDVMLRKTHSVYI